MKGSTLDIILAAVNVAIATSPLVNPNYVWMNWAAATFLFGTAIVNKEA